MNKHCGRTVFSKIRGCLMAVAESAKGHGNASKAQGGCAALITPNRCRWTRAINTFALSAMLAQTTLAPLTAYAQIRSDAAAPGNQRPTVLNTGNGLPQVNITTPSAAGVSRNQLSQMDVDNRGAVINNSRTNTPTQIGGWVQGNPWLATGEARVILMEVNSQNPSRINGFLEIAGQRSEIIIANPAGLEINGSGFINASRATLTTGEVNLNNGAVNGYTVRGGTITIGDRGFDASLTDYTGILARAVAINGPLVANELNVIAGANQIDATGQGNSPTAGSGAAPSFAIDVSNFGGMYAGKITLLATEAGVGVRNAGGILAGSGGLSLSANGDLINQGNLASQGSASLNNTGRFDNSGQVQSLGALNVQSGAAIDNSGSLLTSGALSVNASGLTNSGQMGAGASAQIITTGAIDNSGSITAADNLTLQGAQVSSLGTLSAGKEMAVSTAGRFSSNGNIATSGTLNVNAASFINGSSGQIVAGGPALLASTGALDNSGAISAGNTLTLQGAQLSNSGSLSARQQLQLDTDGRFDNAGNIASQGRIAIQAPQGLGNSGSIQSQSAIGLQSNGAITNSGKINAAADTQITTAVALDNSGNITAGADLALRSAQLSNTPTGSINAGQRATLLSSGNFTNGGELTALDTLNLNATDIGNNGKIVSGAASRISATGNQIGRAHV